MFLRIAGAILGLAVLGVLVGFWYYIFGRRPHVAYTQSIPAAANAAFTVADQGRVALLTKDKVTLIDVADGTEKWTVTIPKPAPIKASLPVQSTQAPQPVVATSAASPVKPQAESGGRKSRHSDHTSAASLAVAHAAPTAVPAGPDADRAIAEGRLKREFARLTTWSQKLNEKRANLKTKLQIDTFNEEAALYHAALASARAESARLNAGAAPLVAQVAQSEGDWAENFNADADYGMGRFFGSGSQVIAIEDRVWVLLDGQAIGFQMADGKLVKQVALPRGTPRVFLGEHAFFVETDGINRTVTRIQSRDGASTSVTAPRHAAPFSSDDNPEASQTEFSASADSLLRMDVTLVTKKLTKREAIKGNREQAWEEWDKKSSSGFGNDALEMAKLAANDLNANTTGGTEIVDESTYSVSLTHPLDQESVAWTSNVAGTPRLFSSKTLDFIAAGSHLYAFDRLGKKIWEATLGESIVLSRNVLDPTKPPCLDIAGAVCVYDRAFLTAFERGTGKVLWRLPSVGITKVQADASDMLYVCTANGSRDSLRYSQDARFAAEGELSILKVDPAKGNVLWSAPKYEDCFVSGNGIYATRFAKNSQDAVNGVFDHSKTPECRFLLSKLSARTGTEQWQLLRFKRPVQIDAHGREVNVLFPDQFEAVKSLAL